MRYLTKILVILILFCSCDDDDNSISIGLLAEHQGVYINDFYNGGILGDSILKDNLFAWVDENDFTDIYLYNIGAALGAELDNDLRSFIKKHIIKIRM